MKKHILIISLCISIGIFTSYAQDCDTLKWKTIETYYCKDANFTGDITTNSKLEGATINIDTLSTFYPCIEMVNISNDTFFENTAFVIYLQIRMYADTGLFAFSDAQTAHLFANDHFPEDTLKRCIKITIKLDALLNSVEGMGLAMEDIDHWECIIGLSLTTREGLYSDSVFFASADTSIFYITRTPPPSIQETTPTEISVFPNPAQSHFTVTNTENANLTLYNILGQQVKQVIGEGESTIIYTEDLPQGIYLLKVEKEGAVLTKKIQISN